LYPTRVTWCVANFVHPTTLKFQCDLKCKALCVRYEIGSLVCEE